MRTTPLVILLLAFCAAAGTLVLHRSTEAQSQSPAKQIPIAVTGQFRVNTPMGFFDVARFEDQEYKVVCYVQVSGISCLKK